MGNNVEVEEVEFVVLNVLYVCVGEVATAAAYSVEGHDVYFVFGVLLEGFACLVNHFVVRVLGDSILVVGNQYLNLHFTLLRP